MFKTDKVKHIFHTIEPLCINTLLHTKNLQFDLAFLETTKIKSHVGDEWNNAKSENEDVLNEFYVLDAFGDIFKHYVQYWKQIIEQEFANSWITLQDALDCLRLIKKFSNPTKYYVYNFFENQFIELEKIYPYRVFASVGMVVGHFECSICGKDIDSRECPHVQGDLYMGKMACGIARDIKEIDHISLVSNPEDKRCVLTLQDDSTTFNILRYLLALIQKNEICPLTFYKADFTKEEIPVIKQGRNEPCQCGSGMKFKKCCMDKTSRENNNVCLKYDNSFSDTIMDSKSRNE